MRLKLKNFRCYLEKEFDFGENGLILLSGPSGSGKSTIFMAINFVLYGIGNKLATYGKTNCQVDFYINNLHISRSKRPNRLVLRDIDSENTMEDDAAQASINDIFGSNFDISSYVQQNNRNCFVLMSPTEKLEFLEKLAFSSIDLEKIKTRCNVIIKKRNEELVSTTSKLEIAVNYLENFKKPVKVSYPIKTDDKNKTKINEEIRYKNSLKMIKKYSAEIERLKAEITDYKISHVKISSKKEYLSTIKAKLANVEKEYLNIDYKGDDVLADYEKILQTIIQYKNYITKKEKYDNDTKVFQDMKNNEKDEIISNIKSLEDNLWRDIEKIDIDNQINDCKQYIIDCREINRIKKELQNNIVDENSHNKDITILENLKNNLQEYQTQLNIYKCPSCDSSLKLENNILILSDVMQISQLELNSKIDNCKADIRRLQTRVENDKNRLFTSRKLQTELNEYIDKYQDDIDNLVLEDLQTQLDDTIKYKNENVQNENKIKKLKSDLKSEKYSNTVENFGCNLERLRLSLEKLQITHTTEYDEEDIRNNIAIQREKKYKYDNCIREMENYKKIISDIELELEKLYLNCDKNLDTLESELLNYEKQVALSTEKSNKHAANLKKIEEYDKYMIEYKKYKELADQVKNLKTLEDKNKKLYSASTLLKEKILEAESISMACIIKSINTHVQEFLDMFFPTDPITISLSAFKETKKNTKPQINLEIDYKGMEADVNTLSGGELSRVILAFTLALAEMSNSPLILLDECTASIDQDLTATVIEGIRKNFPDKMIMVIAHQVVSGVFDREYKMTI